MDRRRAGFTLVELSITVTIVLLLTVVGEPHWCGLGRRAAKLRACRANCATIAGALEMFELDFDTRVTALDPDTVELLEERGYVQRYPRDPGGRGRYELLAPTGKPGDLLARVTCTHHGPSPSVPSPWGRLLQGNLSDHLERLGAPQPLRRWVEALETQLPEALAQSRAAATTRARLGGALGVGALLLLGLLGHLRAQARPRRRLLAALAVAGLAGLGLAGGGLLSLAPTEAPADFAALAAQAEAASGWTGAPGGRPLDQLVAGHASALAEAEGWAPGAALLCRELEAGARREQHPSSRSWKNQLGLGGLVALLAFFAWTALGYRGLGIAPEDPDGAATEG